jgi:Fe/S biogenesis protein NfuA
MERVLRMSDEAYEKVMLVRSREAEGERYALFVEVAGVRAGAFAYDFSFGLADEARHGDVVERHEDLVVVIPAASVEALRGALLERRGDLETGGLVLHNPNTPASVYGARPPADLSGDVARRIIRVLEEEINPAIAAHGGSAELVAVEDGAAYLRFGGGCVGCGMVSVTLAQGVEVAIRRAVPAVTRIVDVTDHASGTNPYYEPAQK